MKDLLNVKPKTRQKEVYKMNETLALTRNEIVTMFVVLEDMIRKGTLLTNNEKELLEKIKLYLGAE
jgi:hypothetical protein